MNSGLVDQRVDIPLGRTSLFYAIFSSFSCLPLLLLLNEEVPTLSQIQMGERQRRREWIELRPFQGVVPTYVLDFTCPRETLSLSCACVTSTAVVVSLLSPSFVKNFRNPKSRCGCCFANFSLCVYLPGWGLLSSRTRRLDGVSYTSLPQPVNTEEYLENISRPTDMILFLCLLKNNCSTPCNRVGYEM